VVPAGLEKTAALCRNRAALADLLPVDLPGF